MPKLVLEHEHVYLPLCLTYLFISLCEMVTHKVLLVCSLQEHPGNTDYERLTFHDVEDSQAPLR